MEENLKKQQQEFVDKDNKEQQDTEETKESQNTEKQEDKETSSDSETKEQKTENSENNSEDTIESLGKKLLDMNDKYLRIYSEFENYRKRTNKERLEIIENASEDTIKALLPVLDDFERALQNMEKSEDELVKQMSDGMTLIYKKLFSILERKGLKPIEAKGQVFDENLHEAVTMFPAPKEEDKGKVIDETEKGYYLNNKVIRFSKVVVAQ
ncbi:MAG: nucleotide exchange factor GrpE [Bacteroidales bacterium]|nr:nucleotide exchange factor GrpE [Bacteroidales bacterium]MBQ9255430.1 nucleotide exchange factor GrpE [Bacteroidales bacterium]